MATAAEVLESGGYRSLPAAIEELRPAPPPAPAARAAALRLMDQMLRSRLLQARPNNLSAMVCSCCQCSAGSLRAAKG